MIQPQEIHVLGCILKRAAGSLVDRRIEPLELGEISARAQHEDAAVPEVAAGGKIALRLRAIRLLAELIDRKSTVRAVERRTLADIAVPGVGLVGLDAEEDQSARRCDLRGLAHVFEKAHGVRDDVIRRHHEEDSVGILAHGEQCGGRHRRSGVARDRLEHDRLRLEPGAGELLAHEEAVIVVADHDRGRKGRVPAEPLERAAQEAATLAVEEADELLWVHGPG